MIRRRRQQPAPARTETAEPRSLEQAMRNRLAAKDRRIQELTREVGHYQSVAAGLEMDLTQADATIAAQVKELAAKTVRVADLEHLVQQLGIAAYEKQRRHDQDVLALREALAKAQRAQADRAPGTDPQPTGVVPLATGGLIPPGGPLLIVGEVPPCEVLTPWQTGAWGPRSSTDTHTTAEEIS